jgi:hypothetical protein
VIVRRTIALILLAGLAPVSLVGCGAVGLPSPGAYVHVDALASQLDLNSVGKIQYSANYGTDWMADHPTFLAIISGPDASARISNELRKAGLKPAGPEMDSRTLWNLTVNDTYVYTVTVREVQPGDKVGTDGTKLIPVKESGIAIYIS